MLYQQKDFSECTCVFVPAGNNPPPLRRSDSSNMNPRKKRRIAVTTPRIHGTIFTGNYGTKWEVISTAHDTETGRTAEQNVMRETPWSYILCEEENHPKRSHSCVFFICI